MRNIDKLPDEGEKVVHRLKRDGGYIILCDKNGDPIPKQIYCSIQSQVGEPIRVTIECLVDPIEIEDEVLKEFEYEVVHKNAK